MSIQSEITRINTEVSTQSDLLAQIKSALEGKAAGGGSASVETCTVGISYDITAPSFYLATCYLDGKFYTASSLISTYAVVGGNITIENVVSGSPFVISGTLSVSGDYNKLGTFDTIGVYEILGDCAFAYTG